MKLTLLRASVDGYVTRGSLYIDGVYYCSTVEPAPNWKRGPIPLGTYGVEVTYSPKFRKYLPHIYGVKGFTGIRIHGGSKAEHTEGCVCIPLAKVPLLTKKIENEQEAKRHVLIDIKPAYAGAAPGVLNL